MQLMLYIGGMYILVGIYATLRPTPLSIIELRLSMVRIVNSYIIKEFLISHGYTRAPLWQLYSNLREVSYTLIALGL